MTVTAMDRLLRPHLDELAKATATKDKECWRTEEEISNWYAQYRTK